VVAVACTAATQGIGLCGLFVFVSQIERMPARMTHHARKSFVKSK
jgi:hypothetical protein